MRVYKHVLILELVGSFTFDVILILFRPVLLWPMRAAITTGILGGQPYSVFIVFGAALSGEAMIVTIQVIQFVYRASATYDNSHWIRRMLTKNVSHVYYCYFIMFSVLICIHLAPVLTNIDDPMKSQALFLADFPALKPLVCEHPFLTGYHPEVSNFTIDAILYYGMVMGSSTPFVCILAIVFFVSRMKLMKTTETQKTYTVHLMLFRALVAQNVFMFVFLALPLTVFVYCLYFEVLWGSYIATLSLVVISFHIIACCLSILWFIVPYRLFVRKCFRKYCKIATTVSCVVESKIAPSG
uniref:Serpentine Receptor, class H n=1 Tax=Panagrellus redivivus TaxID=6233 RepID=A0A7E4WC33_PANRE